MDAEQLAKREALSEKLFTLLSQELLKDVFEVSPAMRAKFFTLLSQPSGDADDLYSALDGLTSWDWSSVRSRWKTKLKRLGITEVRSVSVSNEFYLIDEPLSHYCRGRCRNRVFLEIPVELANKFLVLGIPKTPCRPFKRKPPKHHSK